MGHGMTCSTYKNIGGARLSKVERIMVRNAAQPPPPPFRGGVVEQGMKRGAVVVEQKGFENGTAW